MIAALPPTSVCWMFQAYNLAPGSTAFVAQGTDTITTNKVPVTSMQRSDFACLMPTVVEPHG